MKFQKQSQESKGAAIAGCALPDLALSSTQWVAQIGLQFPDALLGDSVPVYRALKSRLEECELYILADTTYGRCVSLLRAEES